MHSYMPSKHMSHVPYTTVLLQMVYLKQYPQSLKLKKIAELWFLDSKTRILTLTPLLSIPYTVDSTPKLWVNTQAHRPTTYLLDDASKNFLSSFSDKTPVRKSTINSDEDTTIISEGLDTENNWVSFIIFFRHKMHSWQQNIHNLYY